MGSRVRRGASSTRRRVSNGNEDREHVNRQASVTSPVSGVEADTKRRGNRTRNGGAEHLRGGDGDEKTTRGYLERMDSDDIIERHDSIPYSQSLDMKPTSSGGDDDRKRGENDVGTTERIQIAEFSTKNRKGLKLIRRIVAAFIMFLSFISILYAGHELIACFVVLLQVLYQFFLLQKEDIIELLKKHILVNC